MLGFGEPNGTKKPERKDSVFRVLPSSYYVTGTMLMCPSHDWSVCSPSPNSILEGWWTVSDSDNPLT